MASSLSNLSSLLRKAGRHNEARQACDRARALLEPLVKDNPLSTYYRFVFVNTELRTGQLHLDAGDPAAAAAAWRRGVALFDGLKSPEGEQTILGACCNASLSGLASWPGSGVSAEEGRAESDRAMTWLRQAVALGYRNPDAYRTEDALNPLRNRDDFQLLMKDLAFPADPFTR